MSAFIIYNKWKYAIIENDATKTQKLISLIQPARTHCFPNVSSFNHYLQTTGDAEECLVVIISSRLRSGLPQDIEQNTYRVLVYGENDEHGMPSFKDVCLLLSDLLLAQGTEQYHYSCHLNDRGLTRALARELISRHDNAIQQLEDLCAAIDDEIPFGEETDEIN